jgi:GNAT superfamily N-acetyltransferase
MAKKKTRPATPRLSFHALTPDRWTDLEQLFGERGACDGCWCMAWRLPRGQWHTSKGDGNRKAMRSIVKGNEQPGVLAYAGKDPIGWCAIAPRQVYVALTTSRVLKPIDEQPVWSISCLFIKREFRRQGVSVKLLREAVKFAKRKGAKIVEGYPVVPYTSNMPAAFAWTGTLAAFTKAGFKEAARRSKARPIMRKSTV